VEALSKGLRLQMAQERSEEVFNSARKAFFGFLKEELLILDGVVLAPAISSTP
jgi:hypothetical protein